VLFLTIFWGDVNTFASFISSVGAVAPKATFAIAITPEWENSLPELLARLEKVSSGRFEIHRMPNQGFGANMNKLASSCSNTLEPNDVLLVSNNDGYFRNTPIYVSEWMRLQESSSDASVILSRTDVKRDPKRHLFLKGADQAVFLTQEMFGLTVQYARTQLFEIFDSRFFMFWEDVDLELRLGEQKECTEAFDLGFVHMGAMSMGLFSPKYLHHFFGSLRTFLKKRRAETTFMTVIQVIRMTLKMTLGFAKAGQFDRIRSVLSGFLQKSTPPAEPG
jgi:hypothetical protein